MIGKPAVMRRPIWTRKRNDDGEDGVGWARVEGNDSERRDGE